MKILTIPTLLATTLLLCCSVSTPAYSQVIHRTNIVASDNPYIHVEVTAKFGIKKGRRCEYQLLVQTGYDWVYDDDRIDLENWELEDVLGGTDANCMQLVYVSLNGVTTESFDLIAKDGHYVDTSPHETTVRIKG